MIIILVVFLAVLFLHSFISSYTTIAKIYNLIKHEEVELVDSDSPLAIFQMREYMVKDSSSMICFPICGINTGAIYVRWNWRIYVDDEEIEQGDSCVIIIKRKGLSWEPIKLYWSP